MIQVFQYPHKTLNEVSSDWNKEDSIEGYNDMEKFEYDMKRIVVKIGSQIILNDAQDNNYNYLFYRN